MEAQCGMHRAGDAFRPRPPRARGRPADRAPATGVYAVVLLQPHQRPDRPHCLPFHRRPVGYEITGQYLLQQLGQLTAVYLIRGRGARETHDAPPPRWDMISMSAPVSAAMVVHLARYMPRSHQKCSAW